MRCVPRECSFFRLVILRFLNGCQAPAMANTTTACDVLFPSFVVDSTGGYERCNSAEVRPAGRPAQHTHFPSISLALLSRRTFIFLRSAQRWTQKKISVSPADAICAYSWIFLRLPNKSQYYVQLRKADAESHFFSLWNCNLPVISGVVYFYYIKVNSI